MASSSSDSASASASFRQPKHKVFLSFRGEDTRNNFLRYLYDAFQRKGVGAYADFKELPRGEEISHALLQVIEESMISIIVFSQNYATSSWCLEELSMIMECRESRGQIVVPIFYLVNPSDIRKQTGSFGKAFVEHERSKKDKVQGWKRALKEAGNLSGWSLGGDKPEPIVIEEIVHDVLNKLNRLSKRDYKGLIGISPHMEQIKSLLCIGGDQGVRIIGIWGMGGIGKTTLAQIVYDEVSAQFESCYFLANVGERSTKPDDVIALRDKLLSNLLNENNLHIDTPLLGSTFIKDRLCRKRVLVVLDDVNDFDQLEKLAISRDHFGSGSRIIVTSRDKLVLAMATDEELIYEVKELSYSNCLRLFSWFAFKQDHPVDDFKHLSNRFLEYAKGETIALRVLGSALYRKQKVYWEAALEGLKQCADPKIQDVLAISFYKLNEEEKNIFLDVACFFKWYDRRYATKILEGCSHGRFTHCRISSLIDKCLLYVTNWNQLGMHDLLQEMGRNVVLAESRRPEERTRLWTQDDVRQVLENGEGTKSIRGMLLDQSQIDEVQLHPRAFARMHNLRIIKFYGEGGKLVPLGPGLESLPNNLSYLHWEYCMLKSLPSNFSPKYLVVLILHHSNVEQLWDGDQNLVNLRVLDLQHCENLNRIPNLSTAINIETLLIHGCESLVELPSLIHLKSIHSHQEVISCNNLKKFPELPQHIRSLDLESTAIEEIPESIGYLDQLVNLSLDNSKVKAVSKNICKLESLESFSLDVSPIVQFPEVPKNLKRLVLRWNQIEEIPWSIGSLSQLDHLDMRGSRIHNLPSTIVQLDALEEIFLSNCPNITKFPNVPENIKHLCLDDTPIEEVPPSVSRLKSLASLSMCGCTKLKSLPTSICELKSLQELVLDGCSNLECFPEILKTMECLIILDLSRTIIEVLLPLNGTKQLSNLIVLDLTSCKSLKSLPELPPCLRFLDAKGCTSLERVSKWEQFQYMKAHRNVFLHGYPLDCFMFTNCFKLDRDAVNNIVANAQLRIQCLAEKFAMESYKGADVDDKRVLSCLPGTEISETFKNRSTNSSITIQLSPSRSNKRFLGFALCIVVDFEHHHKCKNFKVKCKYRLKTERGDYHNFAYSWSWPTNLDKPLSFESNHVILLFDGFGSGIIETFRTEHYDEASFEFYTKAIDFEGKKEHIKVQKCGVNAFYVDAVRSNDKEVESSTNYRCDGDEVVDPTNETLEARCHTNLPFTQDEENKCDASILEPNSAIDPNWLSLTCDVNNYKSNGDKAVDPTNETLEDGCHTNLSFNQDEENRCDASILEPNSAVDPNWLSLNFDVYNRELEGSMMDKDANDEEGFDDPTTRNRPRFRRSFSCDGEEEPESQRLKYFHYF